MTCNPKSPTWRALSGTERTKSLKLVAPRSKALTVIHSVPYGTLLRTMRGRKFSGVFRTEQIGASEPPIWGDVLLLVFRAEHPVCFAQEFTIYTNSCVALPCEAHYAAGSSGIFLPLNMGRVIAVANHKGGRAQTTPA